MKTALKWVGWGVLALVVLAVFLQAEKLTQWGIGVILVLGWLIHGLEQTLERRHVAQTMALERLEEKLDQILNHPLNTRYISNGIEAMVDECNARRRGSDDDMVAPLSGEWPFGKSR